MANGKPGATTAAKPPKSGKAPEGPKTVPAFRDKDNVLLKLRRKDFPSAKVGKLAFCDYQIQRWEDRKVRIEKASDPNAKALKKLASYKAKMAELEKQLKADGIKIPG